jgi:hypothetical protein
MTEPVCKTDEQARGAGLCPVLLKGKFARCRGSECMAWTWTDGEYEGVVSNDCPDGEGWVRDPADKHIIGSWQSLWFRRGPDRTGFCQLLHRRNDRPQLFSEETIHAFRQRGIL